MENLTINLTWNRESKAPIIFESATGLQQYAEIRKLDKGWKEIQYVSTLPPGITRNAIKESICDCIST